MNRKEFHNEARELTETFLKEHSNYTRAVMNLAKVKGLTPDQTYSYVIANSIAGVFSHVLSVKLPPIEVIQTVEALVDIIQQETVGMAQSCVINYEGIRKEAGLS